MKLSELQDGKYFRLPSAPNVPMVLLAEGAPSGRRRAVCLKSGTIYDFQGNIEIVQMDVKVEASDTLTFEQLKPGDFFRYRGDLFVILPPVDFCGGGMACKVSGGAHFAPHTPVTKVS